MVANVQGMSTSFKQDLFNGIHAFGTTVVRAGTGADVFKAALFCVQQGLGVASTVYGTSTMSAATCSINGTTLTVAGAVTGYITPGIMIAGAGVTVGTYIVAQLSGTAGAGTGATYTVSTAQTVAGPITITSEGELVGTNYVDTGITITNGTLPTTSGTTAFWTPSANLVWSNLTSFGAFDSVMIYNSTASNKNAVSIHTFGAQNVTAGTFTLTMPANAAGTALLNIA